MLRWVLQRLAPDAAAGAYNDWALVSTTTLSSGWLLVFALLVGVALVASALGLRRLGARRRRLLVALRVVAALAVLAILVMPAIELRAVSKVRSRVALLMDASRSMDLATTDGTRRERAERHLADAAGALGALEGDAVIERYLFGERLRAVDAFPSPLPAEDAKSDVARALADVALQSSGRDLGAILLYSDGADTEGLTVERARELGRKAGVPIHVVAFDDATAAPDLAIRRVVGDDFAFLHNQVTLDVALEQRGLEVTTVPVTLKRDDTVVATKEVTLDASGRGTVSFDFKPTKIGRSAYEVSVPVMPGEAVAANNTRAFVLKVIRDRIRVLQVAGRPSWDERFLRELLKRSPNVDLISFFILRSTTDQPKASQEEQALIPFPVGELFTNEIGSFDVVIFQNFDYRPYRMERYLPSVAEYIERGGSFLMVGGAESFDDGSYAGTALADLLPVRLGGAAPWEMGEYRPRLTPEGRRHPITLIGESGEPPESVYQRLPPLAGFNSSLGLMPGAQALLTHPALPGNPPVVAIREVGEGRTMAVTTDSLWYWRFPAVAEGGAGREFDRLWNNALRWLIRDPELAHVRVALDRAVSQQGEPVSGEIKVLGPDYRGVADAPVVAELWPAHRQAGEAVARVSARTGPEGALGFDLGVVAPGTYVLRASAAGGAGSAETPVIVEASDVETQDPFPHPELLRALAEGSGGTFTEISRPLRSLEIKESRRVEVDRSRVIPVWDGYPALLVLLGALGAEWILRRRAGLL